MAGVGILRGFRVGGSVVEISILRENDSQERRNHGDRRAHNKCGEHTAARMQGGFQLGLREIGSESLQQISCTQVKMRANGENGAGIYVAARFSVIPTGRVNVYNILIPVTTYSPKIILPQQSRPR